MTKIYEALERLEHQNNSWESGKGGHSERSSAVPEKRKYEVLHPVPVSGGSEHSSQELRGIYSGMLFRIEGALKKNGTGNMVQIVGSRSGEGATTVARELAKTAVRDFGRTVLLIDMDSIKDSQFSHFADSGLRALPAPSSDPADSPKIPEKDGEALHVTSLTSTDVVRISSSENGTGSALERLQKNYDMVIIDSPPMEHSQSNPFFPLADAVVLVVQAEKTKHQIVKRSKEHIERQGGNLIGIVLNKKEFHVPEWLYKRL